ncbi:MBL fold metallo-hydrolase [Candidatus Dojkabacteria bacterium]|nr:MBL fold metallo-hydrolase [Candidatus Dojkabacteria bacterium]
MQKGKMVIIKDFLKNNSGLLDSLMRLIWKNAVIMVSVLMVILYRLQVINFVNREESAVIIFDVGQGDAILIQSDDTFGLVDGGPDGRIIYKLENYLHPWERDLRLVVLTHPHKDHMEGLFDVLERFEVQTVWVNAVEYPSPEWEYFLSADELIQVEHLTATYIGRCKVVVLNPIKRKFADETGSIDGGGLVGGGEKDLIIKSFDGNINNDSIVLGGKCLESKTAYGEFDFLLMGDAEVEIEEALIHEFPSLHTSVLKAGHHCSDTSNSYKFLSRVGPGIAVCSIGADNKFGHPSPEAIENFENLGIGYFVTSVSGDVAVEL